MRLIDADALCRSLSDWQFGDFATVGHETEYDLIDEVLTGISAAPTIDAVPVVRCAECRWHEDEQPGMVYCPATVGGWVENDWFCKGGEREEGADNG